MTDLDLLYEFNKRWLSGDYNSPTSVHRELSAIFELSEDSIRGRLSRVNTPENQIEVAKRLANETDAVDPAILRQKRVLERSAEEWRVFLQSAPKRPLRAVFVSDRHLPNMRWDAFKLEQEIYKLINPDIITVQNDFFDNTGYAPRWADTRRAKAKVWSQDLSYKNRLEAQILAILRGSAPNAKFIQVMGNHDRWLYDFYRSQNDGERHVAEMMERLESLEVIQFTRGLEENHVELGKGLVFVHGGWVARLASTNAKNAAYQFADGRHSRNICFGHTHRSSLVMGREFGSHGVVVINSPSMCHNDVEYTKYPQHWDLGLTIWTFHPNTDEVTYNLVKFNEEGQYLTANVGFTMLKVPLDKSKVRYE